jgi:hypothetical protein
VADHRDGEDILQDVFFARGWNWLLPQLFGFPEITLMQGFGLLVLGRILSGFGGGGGHQSKHMTPEERERWATASATPPDRIRTLA